MPIGDKKHILLAELDCPYHPSSSGHKVQKSRAEVLKFFDMMSGAYDFDVNVSFASHILELIIRRNKILVNRKI